MVNFIKKIFGNERTNENMKKVLYITANPKSEESSYGLAAGNAFINAYKKQNPKDQVIEIDVYKEYIPMIDADVFNGWGKLQQGVDFNKLTETEKKKVGRIEELTNLFISADKYVFVTPMWNLSIPPMMKAFIDTICIAGKTFKYTENGSVGLLTDKKGIHIQARGGVYSEGPASGFELGDRYVNTICGFLGIQMSQSLIVEGMAAMSDKAESIKSQAIQNAQKAAAEFAGI